MNLSKKYDYTLLLSDYQDNSSEILIIFPYLIMYILKPVKLLRKILPGPGVESGSLIFRMNIVNLSPRP